MRATKRRSQLLRIATKLFARRGFHQTTTKLIAFHARRNEALLFQHFATKENLYKAVLAAKLDNLHDARFGRQKHLIHCRGILVLCSLLLLVTAGD